MNSANLTRSETAARSAAVTVRDYRVDLDLSEATDQTRAGFATTTTVVFDATVEQTWLDFIGLAVESVTVNGAEVAVEYDGARLTVGGLTETNVVVVRGAGAYSRSGEGLHRFLDPVDGLTYLYTQYEPADARRVFVRKHQLGLQQGIVIVKSASTTFRGCLTIRQL